MNDLKNQIDTAIEDNIAKYVKLVAKTYNLDKKELMNLWNTIRDKDGSSSSIDSKVNTKASLNTKSDTKSKSKSNGGCPYEYIKGKRKGETCGVVSKDGSQYCSMHKKHEGQEPKERKVLPEPKKSIMPAKKSSPVTKEVSRVLRKHKELDMIWHQETGLAFTTEERLVIGKIVNDKLVELTEEDIDTCNKWGFFYQMKKPQKIYLQTETKFWEIELEDKTINTRYGKIGSTGKTTTNTFDSVNLSCKEYQKLIAEKKKKGYNQVEQENGSDTDIEDTIGDLCDNDQVQNQVKKALGMDDDSD
jgi:predicted DNA-binding WGR domain protein